MILRVVLRVNGYFQVGAQAKNVLRAPVHKLHVYQVYVHEPHVRNANAQNPLLAGYEGPRLFCADLELQRMGTQKTQLKGPWPLVGVNGIPRNIACRLKNL